MISVIIPLFNAEKTIIAALESVKNQTYDAQNFEIFVINDDSTDQSKILVEKYISENSDLNITLLNQENKGVSAARNAGLRICNGKYIAFLDADDVWYSEKTSKQMEVLKNKDVRIDFLSCKRKNQRILFPYKIKNRLAKVTFRKLLLRNEVQPSTVIYKKVILENSGLFNENQRYAEDINYWLKISESNALYILNEELVLAGGGKRTFGVSGLSANLREMHFGYLRNLEELYAQDRISVLQYALLYVFYKLKYLVILTRNFSEV